MGNESNTVDYALSNYPIVQAIHIVVVAISFPPVLILFTQISKIALHDNCKFLIRAWCSAFLVCLIIHCAYIACDLITGKYIPESNHDPPIRLLIFGFYGFGHALSSCQELMLSIERAVSCASSAYHEKSLAKRVLFVAEILSAVPAVCYLWQLSRDNVAAASCVTNSVDFASLICLSCTTYYVLRRNKHLENACLSEKYQIKEALDITRVMLPCGIISLVMKVSSTFAAWVYAFGLFDNKYLLTITAGPYLILESLNCVICCTLVLRNHAGLRRITEQLFCKQRGMPVHAMRSAEDVNEIYFAGLQRDWN